MREETLFIEALEKEDPAERAGFLDRACAGDPALRERIERLLQRHEQTGDPLDARHPLLNTTITQPIRERPGTVIGPYKLREQIGEGGFGVVFLAEQDQPLRRKVALKVLKPGMDSRQVISRFEAERQALALMDHPNIARVLDGGETDSGRPYFVMELVKGVPITDYCDQDRLSPRARLELFVQVCHAVQHAHQKGIIHRDLKPSNVMVTVHDVNPVVKVIDFGIAKALVGQLTDGTVYTGFAQMLGTPAYMSPEQAGQSGLDVDTRSDTYSLGVLLYELLTGTTPFDQERFRTVGYDEICRIIREEEPPRPSTRISTLGQAAAKTCEQRQSDPKRLRQLLRGELDWIVMKCLEKDRNRRYESASSLARDVERYLHDEAVQACPPSAWYRFRKFGRRNRGRLTTAAVVTAVLIVALAVLAGIVGWIVRDQAARRAATADQVNLALNEATVLQGRQKWRDALAEVKRAETLLANGGGAPELHHRTQELRKDLEMAVELDHLRTEKTHYTDASFRAGDEWAAVAYTRAFESYGINVLTEPPEQVAAMIQTRSIRDQLVAALDDWILVQTDAGVRERLRGIAALADPDAWRNRLRQAVVQNDRRALEELAARPEVADLPPATGYLLGQFLANAGAGPKAVQVLAALQQRHPQDFWLNYQLGIQFLWGAGVPNRPEVAAGYLRAALVARPDYPTVYVYLAIALPGPEHLDEVIALNRTAIELDPNYATAHYNLGIALKDNGQLDEAIQEYRTAIKFDPRDARFHHNLGRVLHDKGQLDEAIREYREAVRLKKDLLVAHINLGNALLAEGQLDEAIREFRTAIKLDPKDARLHNDLGNVLQDKGQLDDAIREFRTAIKLDPKDAVLHYNLGNALLAKGHQDEAIQEFREALRLKKNFPEAHINLGAALFKKGQPDEAIQEFRIAIDLDPKDARPHYSLGYALLTKGHRDEAITEFRTAIALKPDYAEAHCNLGQVLREQGRFADAVASLRRGDELGSKVPGWAYPSAEWVRQAEQQLALDGKLAKVLKGESQPAGAAEHLALADLCQLPYKRLYAAAARFYADAFTAEPKLADDPRLPHRYNAACAAALAGCGQGEDAAQLDDKERARLRRQAVDWLRADLAAWTKLLDRDPKQARASVRQKLRHWQTDADLAGLRDKDALAQLHEAERATCQKLWADVDALVVRVKPEAKEAPPDKP
jgi:serine/threonine protein kinase/Flp pilus assembly protein TadD